MAPADKAALEQRTLIRRVWEGSLPTALQPHTRLVDFKRHTLWVEVSSSAFSQELQFLKPRLLAALEQALGPGVVKDIQFRIGEGFGGQ